uniref:Histone deacetylase domain-containing protein n=1 Tax=Parascaris univalens TaxID=6257 RepID=A0A914ZKP5_PARUN
MLLHRCNYDSTMLECPQRIQIIYERLLRDGLLIDAQKVSTNVNNAFDIQFYIFRLPFYLAIN